MTGPTSDHTTSSTDGHYIFIETNLDTKQGWKANLISEPFADSSNGCIQFWYHMFGSVSFNSYLMKKINSVLANFL